MDHLLLECAGNFEEELLLANGVGAEEEERALLVESLCPHGIQHKTQHLQAAQHVEIAIYSSVSLNARCITQSFSDVCCNVNTLKEVFGLNSRLAT